MEIVCTAEAGLEGEGAVGAEDAEGGTASPTRGRDSSPRPLPEPRPSWSRPRLSDLRALETPPMGRDQDWRCVAWAAGSLGGPGRPRLFLVLSLLLPLAVKHIQRATYRF